MTRPLSAAARLVTLIVAVAVAVLWSLSSPLTARADDPTEVDITLTLVTPQIIPSDPTARVTITGEVTNTSKVAMTGVQVSFWRSRDPIATMSELQAAAASPWDVPVGERMGVGGTEPTLNLANLTTAKDPSFEPGEKASFTVSARVDQLDLGQGEGVRLLGVHVRGTPVGGTNHTVGRARFFAPMAEPASVQRASIVMLTSAPSMLADQTFVDGHLAGELRGRLNRLIDEASHPGATVLIDPSLYDELTVMAAEQGYRLATGEVTTVGSQLAADFLQRLEQLRVGNTVYRLPYGNPDLALAHQESRSDVVTRAAEALPDDHPLAPLPLAVVPERAVDAGFVDFLEPLEPRLLVLPGASGPLKQRIDDLVIVRPDASLGSGGPGPSPSTTPPQVVGRALSELVLDPASQLVTISDRLPAPVEEVLARHTTLVPLSDLPTTEGTVSWPKAAQGSLVTPTWWALLDDATRRLTEVGDLRGDVAEGAHDAAVITSRASSGSFRGEQALTYLRALGASLPRLQSEDVRIVSAEKFVVSEPTTQLPITVTNNTDQPIAVRVAFTSESPQRLSLEPTGVQVVEPHTSRSLTFTVNAHTNGAVTVRAQLETSTGVPVGPEHRFILTANSLGRVGWVVIVVSGVVVLAATALRIRQVRRERAHLPSAGRVAAPTTDEFVTRDDLGTRPHP